MADNRYQSGVYRKAGGAEFVVTSTGKIHIEGGGYIQWPNTNMTTGTLVSGAAALGVAQLTWGLNWASNATTGLPCKLPEPTKVGGEVWFYSLDGTTGAFPICTSTAGVGVIIGSATEVGTFVDNNTAIQTSGTIVGLKAVTTSQWIVLSNIGGGICSTYTTILASTI